MNTKRKGEKGKGIIGITLAAIMVASIFSTIMPTLVPTVSAGIITVGKFGPDTGEVGDTLMYRLFIENPNSTYNWTGSCYDILPNGTNRSIVTGLVLEPYGTPPYNATYYINYTVESGDAGTTISNWFYCNGIDGSGDAANGNAQKTTKIAAELLEFNFTWERSCCRNVTFTGWASNNSSIVNFTWDFGDGESAVNTTGPMPNTTTHTYTTCGTWPAIIVNLSGCDANGTCNYTRKMIYVECDPKVVIEATPLCYEPNGTYITFNGSKSSADTTYNDSNEITWWKWNFSDGINGTSDNASATSRVVNNTITATLEVSDGHCNSTGSVVINPCSKCKLRIYGTFDEGPGNHSAIDPVSGLRSENPPYTDPVGPFHPQNAEAPRKDFITFNPAIMEHNDGYEGLWFYDCAPLPEVQEGKEKVFKRMWYEKEWFKDHNRDGCFTVVIDKLNPSTGKYEYNRTMCLDDWNNIPEWEKERDSLRIRKWNNDPKINDSNVDIYGPAVNQEFTYMFLDEETMPMMINASSRVLIPMAHHDAENDYRGLNSFDALPNDGITMDYLRVESENTLGFDIDGDRETEQMDRDLDELSGDETVVLVLPEKTLRYNDVLQLFDHKVELKGVQGPSDRSATLRVSDNEGGNSTRWEEVTLMQGDIAFFYRADRRENLTGWPEPGDTFFVRVISIGWSENPAMHSVTLEVGRMFGQTYANIGTNPYWNQKAFMVDGVLYNVVAIKAHEDCIKYISFRQKLPKLPIKLYGKHLRVWGNETILPEMPPFNMEHDILIDVQTSWTTPTSQQDKIGDKKDGMPPLEIDYVDETEEPRYKGELKEIYDETYDGEELWNLEWFHTLPQQYTEFRLPANDTYLVTLSWYAPESEITLWDGVNETNPVLNYTSERFKFWYRDCSGPLYIDANKSSIRIYGTFDEGPGDHSATDPEPGPSQGLIPENAPYTHPVGPFHPQHAQAPTKDFMTFNPAIMEHNQGYPGLIFYNCGPYPEVQQGNEKVFKRMWYEKEWFKDHSTYAGYGDNCFTVVIDKLNPATGKYEYNRTMCLADWNAIPDWIKVRDELRIREHNNDLTINNSNVDLYGPAINQEFTYMFLDEEIMPVMVADSSSVLIPLAHYDGTPYRGLNSFDAVLDDGITMDYVRVESEQTLGFDIDGDTILEPMDNDIVELNGTETLVLVLPEKTLYANGGPNELLFFDHKVVLDYVSGPDDRTAHLKVWHTEGGDTIAYPVSLQRGDRAFFHRGELRQNLTGHPLPGATFYVEVRAINWLPSGESSVRLEVGRMFGQTHANIAVNQYWNQKAFMVDKVLYNVVAIKAHKNCVKYITFRQKLPKLPIKLYGIDLEWDWKDKTLPEMPPFNMPHEIIEDVQNTWTRPYSQQDKIGDKKPARALNITYIDEGHEMRFKGELKEIYNETYNDTSEVMEDEYWNLEWFHTQPQQYTAFVIRPTDQLYLMTLAWYAPESEITLWNDDPDGPRTSYTGERVKFWYDPGVNRDIYVNRVGEVPDDDPPWMSNMTLYYDLATHGGNGNGGLIDKESDLNEVINAILDFLTDSYPFGPTGPGAPFDEDGLIDYILDYLYLP